MGSRIGPIIEWTTLDTETQVQLALGTLPPGPNGTPERHAALTWHFRGKKAKTRRRRREEFHAKVVDVCSGYALQICQALRIYKKACEADVVDNDDTWQRVHATWDWGPLMDDDESSDNDMREARASDHDAE